MVPAISRALSVEAASNALRQAGLRVTLPRLAVYRLLAELGGHHSADELLERLHDRDISLTRASVYNILNSLSLSGLAVCADAGPGRAMFEFASQWHHHFVCRSCGEIFDVPCVTGVKPCLEAQLPEGAELDEAQIIFRGRCAACRAATPKSADRPE